MAPPQSAAMAKNVSNASTIAPQPIHNTHNNHGYSGGTPTQPTPPHLSHSATSAASASLSASSPGGQSVATEDEEDLEDYKPGGYHPVHIGDTFSNGRYVIVRKLGWGHFSTVWLARDETVKRHVALKVVKSDGHYTETALDEIQLLQKLVDSNPHHAGRRHVVQLLDHFRHTGSNGSHVCMVFEVLGENLLGLIKRYQHRGVPQHIVKQITKQVLLGLDYLHTECRIIHTDLKPENVLICIDDVEAVVAAELATCPAAVPTKLVGVPPSQGRGGTQTPRREGIFITGSQPLPSPSSSYGSSPMLDKYGFGMSKISGAGSLASKSFTPASMAVSKTPSTSTGGLDPVDASMRSAPGGEDGATASGVPRGKTADAIGDSLDNVKLSTGAKGSPDGSIKFGEKTIAANKPSHGPSLLSQQLHHTPSGASTPGNSGNDRPQGSTSSETAVSTPATTPDTGFTPSDKGKMPAPLTAANKAGVDAAMASPSLPKPSEMAAPSQTASSDSSLPYNALQTAPAHSTNQPAPAAGDPNTLPPPAPYDPVSLERITVKIADLGNACWVDHHFTNDIQTRQYRCPEIILGTRWGPSADMWSAACLFFELLTGDYLFDPQPGAKYDKDDDHLAQILELLGDMPKSFALSGKYSGDLFNRRGELRHIHKLRYWPLVSVLSEKYLMETSEAELLASFLVPMLDYNSDKRATAAELINHKWLDNVVVQGEIDLMIQNHERQENGEAPLPHAPVGVLTDPAVLKAQLGAMGQI